MGQLIITCPCGRELDITAGSLDRAMADIQLLCDRLHRENDDLRATIRGVAAIARTARAADWKNYALRRICDMIRDSLPGEEVHGDRARG